MKKIDDFVFKLMQMHARLITEKDFDLQYKLKIQATEESSQFVKENMKNVMIFDWSNEPILKYAVNCVKTNGLFLEFGVYEGTSINFIANKISQTIHGFDSFYGLPKDWYGTSMDKDYFNLNGKMPNVRKNVKLHKGQFKDTIPKFKKDTNENIAFMNIDCDIYESTKEIFDLIGDRIQKGTIIYFDEYLNHIYWQEHEYKAFMEFVKKNNVEFDYLAIDGKGHAIVKINSINA